MEPLSFTAPPMNRRPRVGEPDQDDAGDDGRDRLLRAFDQQYRGAVNGLQPQNQSIPLDDGGSASPLGGPGTGMGMMNFKPSGLPRGTAPGEAAPAAYSGPPPLAQPGTQGGILDAMRAAASPGQNQLVIQNGSRPDTARTSVYDYSGGAPQLVGGYTGLPGSGTTPSVVSEIGQARQQLLSPEMKLARADWINANSGGMSLTADPAWIAAGNNAIFGTMNNNNAQQQQQRDYDENVRRFNASNAIEQSKVQMGREALASTQGLQGRLKVLDESFDRQMMATPPAEQEALRQQYEKQRQNIVEFHRGLGGGGLPAGADPGTARLVPQGQTAGGAPYVPPTSAPPGQPESLFTTAPRVLGMDFYNNVVKPALAPPAGAPGQPAPARSPVADAQNVLDQAYSHFNGRNGGLTPDRAKMLTDLAQQLASQAPGGAGNFLDQYAKMSDAPGLGNTLNRATGLTLAAVNSPVRLLRNMLNGTDTSFMNQAQDISNLGAYTDAQQQARNAWRAELARMGLIKE